MNYLLQISVGPVQDFIAAARRTRDLWFGSMMLSEIAKAVALDVKKNGGNLIFPAPENDNDLSPDSELNVANVILAEFNDSDCEQLRKISDSANNAAKARLKVYAYKVHDKMKLNIVEDRWDTQIDDIIEFYSAWVPVINNDYHSARKKVARLLAARKNIRDFNANKCTDKVQKSSLDGLRESVLIGKLPDDLGIKPNETLDAIGLIKRVPIFKSEAEKNRNDFYSITRVALSTWRRGKGKKFIDKDSGFNEKYQELLHKDEFNRETIAWLLGSEFVDKYLPEAPYVAFICADGDKMGATLSNMKTADEHRNFSQKLSKFAAAAREVVKNNEGVCIYTGGDDVMAFMPVDKALSCARALHDKFSEIMKDFPQTSLSVGVSIAHAMENLGMLLDYAREAEGIAKKGVNGQALEQHKDRNGLAISVRSRGNIPFIVREQWREKNNNSELAAMSLDERVSFFAEKFMNGKIPSKFPYELRENANFYENWPDKELLKKAAVNDVIRIFNNKDIKLTDDEKDNEKIKILINSYIRVKVYDAETIRELADELILAQWIGSSMKEGESSEL